MPKINLYFKHVHERKNVLMDFFFQLFLTIASYPRMVIEVIIRKNFGVRYFKLSSAVTVAVLMSLMPFIGGSLRYGRFFGSSVDAISWYVFVLLFAGNAVKHWWYNMHRPGAFDFARFTKYAGDIHPFFKGLRIFGWQVDLRTIETVLEPALFFLIGLFLHLIGFTLGMLLIIVSIVYSMSYFAAYKQGDDFIMDMIDQMIMNEEMENAFVLNKSSEETRGVRFHVQKPKLYTLRQKLADAMVHDPSKVEFTLAE